MATHRTITGWGSGPWYLSPFWRQFVAAERANQTASGGNGKGPVGQTLHKYTRETDTSKITLAIANSPKDVIEVLADLSTGAPTITGGYARWNVVDRPQRAGLTVFGNYDPLELTIPLLFDNFKQGDGIHGQIAILEKMSGRGPGSTLSHRQPPPIIEAFGPLLPSIVFRYDAHGNNRSPLWVLTNIEWDAASFIFNHNQKPVRAACTVTLQQYVQSAALGDLRDPSANPGAKYKAMWFPRNMDMREVRKLQRTTLKTLRARNHYRHNAKLDPYLRNETKKFPRAMKIIVPTVHA